MPNRIALLILAPVLILAGVLGFVMPAHVSLVSGAPAYNVFHLVFGATGLLLVFTKHASAIRVFNIGFGVMDLYQAFASLAHLFPERLFRWTRTDDVLHVVIGAALVIVGCWGRERV